MALRKPNKSRRGNVENYVHGLGTKVAWSKTMQFYMTPGSCSTGIHVLLEELGLVFEAHIVDLLAGDNYKPEYLSLNPRGSVPTLVLDDGTALTDFKSIAMWLAKTHPKRQLLPTTEKEQHHVRHLIDYAVGVVHGEGFTRVFVSDRYASDPDGQASTENEGYTVVRHGFRRLERMITGQPYVLSSFSIADAALFYVEFWADHLRMDLPGKCRTHFEAMLTRPAVRQVLAEEGYFSTLTRNSPRPQNLLRRARLPEA